ncbi:MAG TPA: GXGXG motif-containing protein [Methyloceanibacter sp.]|jgi:methylamine---glutamate N-methyltransferase subunit B|nr:GXGXG motif-containing protein [Methyloceanibacter sp.]
MAEIARSELSEQERRSFEMGLHTELLKGRSHQVFFDFDLKEAPHGFALPNAYDVDFNKRAEIDAADLATNAINLRIRELMDDGYGTIVVRNPGAKHSIAVGILNRLNLIIDGSLGYFGCGLIDGPNVRIAGRVGWSCAENMMSGTILIEKNAGSQFGAAIRGGDLVCRGNVGSRTGIDMKGGTIIVGGDTGAFTGFMMQRGRMVICGNAGKNLGDSMYDGTIFIAGEPQSLGVDAVWGTMTELDKSWLENKLRRYELLPKEGIGAFRKIVAGKQLWNYDNLEPTEKKLVL